MLCLAPLAALTWRGFTGGLGANPIEAVTHATGEWTLRLLLATLAVSPLREALRVPALVRFRRMLGLFAFFYGCLHLLTYLWLDQFFDWGEIARDIAKRPFITAGAVGFALLVPLAVTSTAGWIRRLGGRHWRLLHRLGYFAAAAGVAHYWWLVKSDVRMPALYAAILALLLGYRVARRLARYRSRCSSGRRSMA
jgi:methionine sulfoxide reductase heme-binding subunit